MRKSQLQSAWPPSEVDLVSGSETEAQTARLIDAQPGQPDTLVTVRLGYQQ
jgi:hypothetical protein